MELSKCLALLAVVLPLAYGAPQKATTSLHPEILAAMKRDLGLDADQATARVARENKATDTIKTLKTSTGNSFAGAWFAEDVLHVGVTDQAAADHVTAAGAKPVMRTNSLSKLEQAKKDLDKIDTTKTVTKAKSSGRSSIAAYYVDVTVNKLVIEALADGNEHAKSLASQVGLSESEFEVRQVDSLPRTKAAVTGGDAYFINNSARCSVGFAVTTGFVSAGHCGTQGSSATTSNGEQLGTFAGSVFPGDNDMSFISTVGGTQLNGAINGYGQPNIAVKGAGYIEVGAAVCRSGSTSGVHCGTATAFGATVNYPEGQVLGLTQTNVCAEPGDSGGSFYAGDQALGVTSGGNGDCTSGGTTYFQRLDNILNTYQLTLVTG